MIFAWTKQFLMATGLFTLLALAQTANLVLQEQHLAEKNLEEVSRTVRTPSGNQSHGN